MMELKIEYSKKDLKNEKLDALVVFIPEDSDILESGLREIPKELKKQLSESLRLKIFKGMRRKSHHFYSGYSKIPQLLVIGLGKKNDINSINEFL